MMQSALSPFLPNQAGAVWIGILVTFLVFGDFTRVVSRRNIALAGLLLLAVLFFDILEHTGRRAAWVLAGAFVLTATYAAWGIALAFVRKRPTWSVNVRRGALGFLLVILVVLNAIVALGRPPDDAGYYTNLGALRWTETGRLPYADPQLKGPDSPGYGAAATYGPLLYAAHVPVQRLLRVPRNPSNADPRDPTYQRPPVICTQLVSLAFHLIALASLFVIMHRLAGLTMALGVTAVYAASPYVLGMGGTDFVITGLAFVSHIAPAAVTLLAFALLHHPIASGALLAASAGMLFYPAFLFPLWLGWWIWNDRMGAIRFATGFLISGAVIAAFVGLFLDAPIGARSLELFLESTLQHQEGFGAGQYGASQFSFWGTHPELAGFWQRPVAGSTSLLKPTFLLFSGFSLFAFVLGRGRDAAQLAGLTASLAAAVQLWKTHATGTYVEWYLPFLLIALFGPGSRWAAHRAETASVSESYSETGGPCQE
jgi:hypothetical protein